MSLLQEYKKQLQNNLSKEIIDKRSSYMDAMVNILLRDKTRTPIMKPEKAEVLITYCMDNNAQSLERKSYLMIVQCLYLQSFSEEIDNNINKLERRAKESLASINELEGKLTVEARPNVNKEKVMSELQPLKSSLVKSQEELKKLAIQKKDVSTKMVKLKKYSDKLSGQQDKFEDKIRNILENKKDAIFKMLDNLYQQDQNNQLSGFVFFIKEAYKKSLQKVDLQALLNDIAVNIVETILILPKELNESSSSTASVSKNWFMRNFLSKLIEDEKTFALLTINVNNAESLLESFNDFLAVIIGIHRTVAIHPAEQQLKIEFARKMASLNLTVED